MSDNTELKEFFDPILEVILKYESDYDSVISLREMAEEKLGKNWRDVISEYLVIYDDEVKEEAQSKLSLALDYDGALLAWEEANYLINNEEVTADQIIDRYNDLKEWLQYFGDDGVELIEKLEEKAGIERIVDDVDDDVTDDIVDDISDVSEDVDDVVEEDLFDIKSSKKTEKVKEEKEIIEEGIVYKKKVLKLEEDMANKLGIEPEVLWDFNTFLILNDYYDQTISRIGARCVRMGGLSLNEYPYYGYVLDLLDEIITIGTNIESEEKLIPLFDKYFDGGYKEFKKSLKNYRKEFEENAPPEMIADNANELDRLIKELGKLDVSKIKEKEEDLYSIGRPKSEFDAIDENDQSLPQAPKPPPVSTIKEINSKKDEED